MYRNLGAIRSRNAQYRNNDFSRDRIQDRSYVRDNKQRNGEIDSDSEYRRVNNFSHIDRNEDFSGNSRFSDFTNSSNRRFSDLQGNENQFSTPLNNINRLEGTNSPAHQQFLNILGQPNLQSSTPVVNQQNGQNYAFQQPNVPISPFNSNSGTINQRIDFSPAGHLMNNVQGIRNSGISIAPVARLPTFSPVSSPQFQIPISVPIHNANPYGNYNSMFNSRPADTFINSVPNFSSHQLPGFQVFGGNMQNNGHFGEYHKAMLQSLLHLDKQLVDQQTEVRNVNKKDYPTFPKCDKNGMVTPEEYRAWRRAFLVQLQSDGRLNCVLLPTYVPSHTMCAVPQANDPIFGGHEVLFHNAMRVWSSYGESAQRND